MSWRTNRIVLLLRNLGRTLGLNRRLASLFAGGHYEDRFQTLMLDSIQSGNCVWDIGANVGLYTKQFAERVGKQGRVFAFEPSPVNLEQLQRTVADQNHVVVLPVALGDRIGMVGFQQGADALGATSKVVDTQTSSEQSIIEVEMVRGDELVRAGRAQPPNVIKIDTEGFELDVLEGLADLIHHAALRTLCIEVHFGLLEARGLPDAPARIERRLSAAGFRCTWPDASHIVATRIAG